jgi:protease-4
MDEPQARPMSLAPPPSPPPGRKAASRVWFWLFLVTAGVLLLSLVANFVLGITAVGKHLEEGSVEIAGYSSKLIDGEQSSQDFVAIVPVQGTIMEAPDPYGDGNGSVTALTNLLKGLHKNDHLKGLILLVDSPGGGVTASDRMYHALMEFKSEKKIPIVAIFEDVAASGGYYVSMAADHILAYPTTITGSIGVISEFYNVRGLMKKVGVELNTIKSLNSAGKESFKDIGSPFRAMKPAERVILQSLVTEMWGRFTRVVAEGRKGKLTLARVQELADGRVYTGPQALKLHLIDQVGYVEDGYKKIRELSKSPNAKIVRFSHGKGWAQLLSGVESSRWEGPIPGSKALLDGPRFLYLWSGH